MKKIVTVVEVFGWTESNQRGLTSLWNGREIETCVNHFEDYDFGDRAEEELKKAEVWIRYNVVVNDGSHSPILQVSNYEYNDLDDYR